MAITGPRKSSNWVRLGRMFLMVDQTAPAFDPGGSGVPMMLVHKSF